ncbi:MAG: ParB/RepB/Spo0J family partition protein [Acholeplasmataceae bacterium]|nr:ParB/RepB/Spo0J family partition protein [Acholeplasmataceae bacterium]
MKDDHKRTFQDLLKEHHVDELLEGETVDEIPLDAIVPNPFQPRRVFKPETIDELAMSIKEHGVFQPILVKKVHEGYMIVSGERRFRATKKVGLKTIPAIVRQYDAAKVAEIALAENLQRENLTPIEEAEAYQAVMRRLGLNQNQIAQKIGKSRSHVTNILGLLNLPMAVQDMLLDGRLDMGHARALSKLSDPKRTVDLAKKTIEKSLSVRQVEELTSTEQKTRTIIQKKTHPHIKEEQYLSLVLGVPVTIDHSKITINYKNVDLDEMIERIKGK